ncbi:hypothetical protein U9M48_019782, partial [Paspalum notatum var. saurae]
MAVLEFMTLNVWVGLCVARAAQNKHLSPVGRSAFLARALFYVAVNITIGNGECTLFWSDHRVQGKTNAEIAPNLLKMIPPRILNTI